jgi:hypothetical protein
MKPGSGVGLVERRFSLLNRPVNRFFVGDAGDAGAVEVSSFDVETRVADASSSVVDAWAATASSADAGSAGVASR